MLIVISTLRPLRPESMVPRPGVKTFPTCCVLRPRIDERIVCPTSVVDDGSSATEPARKAQAGRITGRTNMLASYNNDGIPIHD